MSEFVVAIFPSAEQGRAAAQALASPGTVDVRAAALLDKNADGTVVEDKWDGRAPWKAPAGAIVGALIGFLGGPVGAAIGLAGGGLMGLVKQLSDKAVGEGFLREVHTRLNPGKSALVVVLDAGSDVFGARVKELGGFVVEEPSRSA